MNFKNALAPYVVSLLLVTSATSATGCPCSEIAKPAESDASVNTKLGLDFSHTAKYRKEFAAAVAGARSACKRHLGESNVAVVADIDETLLDNRPEYARNSEFQWSEFANWINSAQAKTLRPTAQFLAWARKKGFAVFLITGRTEDVRRGTIENLVKQRVSYDALLMRPLNDERRAEDAKIAHRQYIESLGFKIVTNIGDQYSDLYGGHSEDCQKLPNKMYYIP